MDSPPSAKMTSGTYTISWSDSLSSVPEPETTKSSYSLLYEGVITISKLLNTCNDLNYESVT